jgi:hypothetical protein
MRSIAFLLLVTALAGAGPAERTRPVKDSGLVSSAKIVERSTYVVQVQCVMPAAWRAGDTVTVTVSRNNTEYDPPPLAGQSPPTAVPAPDAERGQIAPIYITMKAPPVRFVLGEEGPVAITDSYTLSVQYARANGTPYGVPARAEILVSAVGR